VGRSKNLDDTRKLVTVSMRSELADAVASVATEQTQSEFVDGAVGAYLQKYDLLEVPDGSKLNRRVAGRGEAKLRRYKLTPRVYQALQDAEKKGYSRSYVIEQAVLEGLTEKGETNAGMEAGETGPAAEGGR